MAEISRPWNGIAIGDAGPYSDEQWADIYKYLLHARALNRGPIIDSGVIPNVGLQVQATAAPSTDVDVLSGAAVVEGTFYLSDSTEVLPIAANVSGNPRIDTIVLQKDYVAQTVRLAVLAGVPAVTPVPTALTQTDGVLWEIPLADIAVASGFATITNADITPRQEWANAADGVYLKDVYNASGQTLQTGDVVVWDSTANRAVTITTTLDDPNTAGVWVGRTPNGGYGRVLSRGIGYVKVGAAVTRGNRLGTDTTGTQAVDCATFGKLGVALQSVAGAGLILANIDIQQVESYLNIEDQKAQNTDSGSFISGAWRTRDLNTIVAKTGYFAGLADASILAANQIVLPAGTYRCRISAPASAITRHQARLFDITAGANIKYGSSAYTSNAALYVTSNSIIVARFTLAVQSTLEVQHQCQNTRASDGFGIPDNFATEIYTQVEIWRE